VPLITIAIRESVINKYITVLLGVISVTLNEVTMAAKCKIIAKLNKPNPKIKFLGNLCAMLTIPIHNEAIASPPVKNPAKYLDAKKNPAPGKKIL